MNKISCIEMYHIRIPLDQPFHPGWMPGYPIRENRFDLIEITTDDGYKGYSASPAFALERAGTGSLIAPFLLGHDVTDIDLLHQRLREINCLGIQANWIEPAFWDILGKLENKPVYELLGCGRKAVELYASTGEIKGETSRVFEAEKRYEEGFKTLKLRIHDFDVEKDISQVKAVVDAVGDKMTIGVDAGQGNRFTLINDTPLWDIKRAGYFADACAEMKIAWLENPLPTDDYENLAALTKQSKIPISGGGAGNHGKNELQWLLQNKCFTMLQPDAITCGIQDTLKIAEQCRENGCQFTPHTWTNGIGFAINLHVFLASGFNGDYPLEYPLNPPSWTIEKRDGIIKKPFYHEKGIFHPTYTPGLGFEIDPEKMVRYGKKFFKMNRKKLFFSTVKEKGLYSTLKLNSSKKKSGSYGVPDKKTG